MIHSNYSAAGTLEFLSSTTATGDPTTTRVTIDRTGKIGVGTISPSELLTLNSTDIYKLSLKHSDGSAAALGASSNNFLFYNNGSERMRITSAGNVGIGTSSPSLPLHIYNSGAALAYFESTNANGAYAIWRNSGTSIGDVGAALGISGSGSASDFMIASRSGNMILGTGSSEKMRITSGGNVGIGTSSPSDKLDVAGNIRVLSTGAAIIGSTESIFFAGTGFGNYLGFGTSNAERMRITSGGLVGIGTSSPASKLNISGDNITVSAGYGIAWAGDQTRIMTPEDNVSGALIRYGSGGIMRFVNGSTEHMRINGSGNVGINTSSPSYKLDVNGDIRSTGAIRVNTGTIDTALTFDTSAGAVGTVTNHNLNFWINGTTQAKLTTDAQLYVGTGIVSSSAKVQIDSTTKGFLPPRMTSLQRIAIASPAVGLMVYQTDNAGGLGGNEGLYIYKSGGWTFII